MDDNSILNSIKKNLGIKEDYKHFDPDIIMHINSAFFTLNQLGVGTEEPFVINDENTTWADFYSDTDVESVKTYITLKVRQVFDPPTNSYLTSAIGEMIKELEWRMNVAVDPKDEEG